MKRVLFICKYPVYVQENLKRKFDGQMYACISLGYQVHYLEWDGVYFSLVCKNSQEKRNLIKTKVIDEKIYYHTKYFIDLFKAAAVAISQLNPHYIYMRAMPLFSSAVRMVEKISSQTKFIIEFPSYPPDEEKKSETRIHRRIGQQISAHYEKKVFPHVDLFALCGHSADGTAYGRPAIEIINGIDVKGVPLRTPEFEENSIHLLLLASMCFWHGYDRIIMALANYEGETDVILHFVGDGGDGSLKKWKELVERYNLSNNVIFHGALYGEDLDHIVNKCDVGVSSLGAYRKCVKESASLKVREYMSRGLPFVYAEPDVSLSENFEYNFHVPNSEQRIDLDNIVVFAKRMREDYSIPMKMRKYAEEHMSWENEFKKIFAKVDFSK